LNLGYTRSWFQTPNSYDSQLRHAVGEHWRALRSTGRTDCPSVRRTSARIQTVNIAPSYTHVINPSTVLNAGYFFRRDSFNYYPSANPFADRGAPDLTAGDNAQQRTLANTGQHSDLTIARSGNNIKAGISYTQTFLNETSSSASSIPHWLPILRATPLPSHVNPCTALPPYDLTPRLALRISRAHRHQRVRCLCAGRHHLRQPGRATSGCVSISTTDSTRRIR